MPCGFTTPLSCELRRLGFSLPLHCSALFNHGQVTPFIVYIAAFGRFMRRSRIPKHSCRHIYSRCEVRSCGAGMHRSAAEGRFGEAEPAGRASVCAGARTLGVDFKGRMGAGNPLSPRHVELVLNQPSSCKDRESALEGRLVCCTLQTCRRQPQNIIQRPKSPLEHREAAERECTEAQRREDSAKPNPQGAQASAREPERSE